MKKQFKEFLIFTAIPFILPTLASFVEASPYEEILWTIAVMGMVIDCVFAFKFYKKYDNCKWYNKVYRISPIKYTGFRHKVYKFSP